MMKIITCFLVLIFAASCKKEYPEPDYKPMIGGYTSFTTGARFISVNANELIIENDIAFVYNGSGLDDTGIDDSVFHNFEYATHYTNVISVTGIQQTFSDSYSNLICLDMSDGWLDYDPFNIKTRALTKAIKDGKLNPENEMAIGTFARDGYYTNPYSIWVDTAGNPYQQTTESMQKMLIDKHWEYGGTSNFYDALDYMIDAVLTFSSNPNRQITVLCHSYPDDQNILVADSIIAKAKANNIKINLLLLNEKCDWEMARIPLQTGGFLQMITPTNYRNLYVYDTMDEGSPLMASLDRILSRNNFIYRVRLQLLKKSGNWQPGTYVYDAYQTLERYDGIEDPVINNYVPYYVEIP